MDISRFQEFLMRLEEVIGEMEDLSEKERMSG